MNKLMTASISPPVCKILDVCQSCVCLWFDCGRACVHSCIPLSVSLHTWSLSAHVCALQAVCAQTRTHTYTLGKKTKPISLLQTHQWSSRGSLGQSKTAILRCRRDPVESCNLRSRSLTWWRETAGFAWICFSDLLRGVRAGLNVTLCQVTSLFPLCITPRFLYVSLTVRAATNYYLFIIIFIVDWSIDHFLD